MAGDEHEHIDLLEDIEDVTVTETDLEKLSKLVQEARNLEGDLLALEESIKLTKERYRTVTENLLPTLMFSVGVSSFTTDTGLVVKVEKKYNASIPVGKADQAFQWLEDHNYEAIIKNLLSIQFDRSEHNVAVSLAENLKDNGYVVENKQSVHPSTLKAFVKTEMEKGVDIPQDLFGVFVVNRAIIK